MHSPLSKIKIKPWRIVLVWFFFLFSISGHSQTSTSSGDWKDITWSVAGTPTNYPYNPDDAVINTNVIIPKDELIEVNNLTIGPTGVLAVKGNLIVHGSVIMENKAQFEMDSTAVVVVKGNFTSGNLLKISVSSLLIIQGDFIKGGSFNQGDLTIDEGNIYIFGEVDGDWGIDDCDATNESGNETGNCDYGTEEEFTEEDPVLPPEIIDKINCFDLDDIADSNICPGATADFRVVFQTNVSYEWQVNKNNTGWQAIAGTANILTIPNTTREMEGYQYRVVATPTNVQACKISISKAVSINFPDTITWEGTLSEDWEDPRNWSCNSLPTSEIQVIIPVVTTNYPVINAGEIGLAKDLTVDSGALVTVNGSLQISGTIESQEGILIQNGSLTLKGSIFQTLPAGSLVGNTIEDLWINNSNSAGLEGELNLTGTLTLETGNLVTNDHLKLISTLSKTALISGLGTGNITGNLTMQRYLNPAYGYKYFSSPFKGTTVADFVPFMELMDSTTNFPHFYSYKEDRTDTLNNDLSGWEAYTDPSGPLKILEGYALNFGAAGGAVTIELSGEVNNGPQTRTLSNHNGTYTGGFHLVGNPYPSPIDWDSSAWTRENIDDAIYFFSAGTTDPYTGAYRSYVNGLSSDGNTTGIIPSMQGFFVHVNEIAPEATLSIDNGARVEDFSQEFHKSAQKKKTPLLRISAGFEGEETSDPTVIYLDRNASTAFDSQLDAYKLMNTHSDVPSLYSLSPKQEELSINAIASTLSQGLARIPLGYKTLRAGNLELQLRDLDLPPGFHIYLVDLEKGLYIDLQKQKTYTTPINKGSSDRRFEVVLSEKAISDPAKLLNIPMSVYGNKEKLTVTLNLEQENSAELTVSTLTGQVVESITTSSKKVEIEGIKSAGVYIINLRSGKTHYTKKILIK